MSNEYKQALTVDPLKLALLLGYVRRALINPVDESGQRSWANEQAVKKIDAALREIEGYDDPLR